MHYKIPRWLNPQFGLFVEAEGSEGAGGEGGKKDEGGEGEDYKSKYEALAKETSGLIDRLGKLEKLETERKTALEKQAEDERIKKGEAEKLLGEKNAEIEAARKRLEEFENREKDRARSLFDKLPQTSQEKLRDFESKLGLTDWVALLEKEGSGVKGNESPPPVVPGGRVAKKDPNDRHAPTKKAEELLDEIGRDDTMLRRLNEVQDTDETGARAYKFRLPVREFFKNMITPKPVRLNSENAAKRSAK